MKTVRVQQYCKAALMDKLPTAMIFFNFKCHITKFCNTLKVWKQRIIVYIYPI